MVVSCCVLCVVCCVLGVGCWVLGVGCWVLGVGCWVLGVGCFSVLAAAHFLPVKYISCTTYQLPSKVVAG